MYLCEHLLWHYLWIYTQNRQSELSSFLFANLFKHLLGLAFISHIMNAEKSERQMRFNILDANESVVSPPSLLPGLDSKLCRNKGCLASVITHLNAKCCRPLLGLFYLRLPSSDLFSVPAWSISAHCVNLRYRFRLFSINKLDLHQCPLLNFKW